MPKTTRLFEMPGQPAYVRITVAMIVAFYLVAANLLAWACAVYLGQGHGVWAFVGIWFASLLVLHIPFVAFAIFCNWVIRRTS